MADIEASIDALPPLREVIRSGGLDARKNLGQNFLLDMNLTERIAGAAKPFSETVIEIGPGPGGLTRSLLKGGAKVIAIEKDPRSIVALKPLIEIAEGNFSLIHADALKTDLAEIAEPPFQIVANLPYNIATTLLLKWLKHHRQDVSSFVLMFQKEVACRITAEPATKNYGRLSVMCQWVAQCEALFDIPRDAFVPKPKVTSTLVRITPRQTPLAPAEQPLLEEVTRVLLGQRRKMIRSVAKALTEGDAEAASSLLKQADIDGEVRAETLSVEKFCALAEALKAMRS